MTTGKRLGRDPLAGKTRKPARKPAVESVQEADEETGAVPETPDAAPAPLEKSLVERLTSQPQTAFEQPSGPPWPADFLRAGRRIEAELDRLAFLRPDLRAWAGIARERLALTDRAHARLARGRKAIPANDFLRAVLGEVFRSRFFANVNVQAIRVTLACEAPGADHGLTPGELRLAGWLTAELVCGWKSGGDPERRQPLAVTLRARSHPESPHMDAPDQRHGLICALSWPLLQADEPVHETPPVEIRGLAALIDSLPGVTGHIMEESSNVTGPEGLTVRIGYFLDEDG